MSEPKYIVGIDLGTTNSVVAYAKTDIEDVELISALALGSTVKKIGRGMGGA